MLYKGISSFAADEAGGGTIFGLLWFALTVGICGLAVDITNGFRARTMLQATADATSLASAIDLPSAGDVVASAVSYSIDNMSAEVSGAVLDPTDVVVGKWDEINNSLDTASAFPDAVMVTVFQSEENSNPLPVNFLRIIGLQTWNVRAQAVAQRFIPECLKDGLIAREMVDMSSNNRFVNRICIHGNLGVNMQSNNYFETGVAVSMPDLEMLEVPASGMSSNTGLHDALREDILDPRMVNHVDEIMQQFLDKDPEVLPGYIDADEEVIVVNNHFNFNDIEHGRIYHVQCQANQNLVLPANIVIDRIVLIADCQVTIGAGVAVYSSVIGSRSGAIGGNGDLNRGDANITAAANVQLGVPDNCAEGGGVQLFSNATMTFSSTTRIDGVQMVAAGDIALGARDQGINGISAQSGGTIYLTSNNMFGLCSGGAPNLFTVDYYRLVL